MTKYVRVAALVSVVSIVALPGCADPGGGGGGSRDSGRNDGGAIDAGHDGGADGGPTCMTNADCPDDGQYCNGTLECTGGRCVVANVPTCTDGIQCTDDHCDPVANRCVNSVNDANCPSGLSCSMHGCVMGTVCEFDVDCDDGVFCNGVESCVTQICMSSGMRDCDDHSDCTMDGCSDAMGMCTHDVYPDVMTNVAHCGDGTTCMACPSPAPTLHQVATCAAGACGVVCETGYVDLDGNMANGCEFMCTPSAGVDLPDDTFADSNCDGIDGDRTLAIFVATTGTPANDGLTAAHPVGTLAAAFAVFAAHPERTQILVANGTYSTSTPLSLPSGVGIYGGYGAGYTTRTDTRAQVVASGATAVIADHLTAPTVIDRVSLTTMSQTGASAYTATLIVDTSFDNLTLRFLSVVAGRGGNGGDGGTGATGSDGTRGSDGSGASGGGGGSVGGGMGASGASRGPGPAGAMGGGGSCGTGGSPGPSSGSGGLGCGDGNPQPGGMGGTGCTGTTGTGGTAGDGIGTLTGRVWAASTGGTGTTGGTGGGGGGGGAGGGESCTDPVFGTCIYCDTGRGGGGGGGGGRGGVGGRGGTEGGASIGIILIDSTITVTNLRITTSGGGNGGIGGAGGNGGTGGPGGSGVGSGNSSQGAGGNGGTGGPGGPGGCGGGGGGGPTFGIWGNGPTAQIMELTATIYTIGSGGSGGTSCGSSGQAGQSGNTHNAITM